VPPGVVLRTAMHSKVLMMSPEAYSRAHLAARPVVRCRVYKESRRENRTEVLIRTYGPRLRTTTYDQGRGARAAGARWRWRGRRSSSGASGRPRATTCSRPTSVPRWSTCTRRRVLLLLSKDLCQWRMLVRAYGV
jgi:hypothetical protein